MNKVKLDEELFNVFRKEFNNKPNVHATGIVLGEPSMHFMERMYERGGSIELVIKHLKFALNAYLQKINSKYKEYELDVHISNGTYVYVLKFGKGGRVKGYDDTLAYLLKPITCYKIGIDKRYPNTDVLKI